MEPTVEQLDLPKIYGNPTKKLSWDDVRTKLETALQYWMASTRPDGRPHTVPRDGVWLDDTFYYGGSPETVHNQNIERNPAVSMHIGEGMEAIIVEGRVSQIEMTPELAEQLATGSQKYKPLGYAQSADDYMSRGGILALKASRVIAWNLLFEDATRFTFPA